MDKKVKTRLVGAILFSAGFMLMLLARVEWKHFILIAGRAEAVYLLAAYGVFLTGNFVRTLRFAKLDHTGNKLTYWWNTNAFYNFMTATLPGGGGEAATVYVLKRFSMLNMIGALRILLISRVMDVSALSVLFFMAAVRISSATPYREAVIWLTCILFFITLIALIPASERILLKILKMLPGKILFIKKITEKLNELLEIIKEQQRPGFYLFTMAQTTFSIIGGVLTLNLILRAFGICFTPVQSVYCYGIYAVFQIVPIQGIAGLGTQAAWFALALNAAGYRAPDAIALGFVLHGTFYLFIASMAFFSMLARWNLNRDQLPRSN